MTNLEERIWVDLLTATLMLAGFLCGVLSGLGCRFARLRRENAQLRRMVSQKKECQP